MSSAAASCENDYSGASSSSSSSSSLFNPLVGNCAKNNDDVDVVVDVKPSSSSSFSSWFQSFYGGFGWERTLFVSFSTTLNTFVLLAVVYFWWANRQFHFRKRQKDGSRLSQLATHKDALHLNAMKKKREKAERAKEAAVLSGGRVSSSKAHGTSHDEDDQSTLTLDIEEDDDESENEQQEEVVDLSDYETDDEEEEEEDNAGISKRKKKDDKNLEFLQQFPPEKQRSVRDFTSVVSNMEVFSYLSREAFEECLEYMEYIDLPQGQVLFDEQSYDGALYAVVSGHVKCQFEFIPHQQQQKLQQQQQHESDSSFPSSVDDEDAAEPLISFTAGDGDVVTSLLSILTGLVRQCQERGGGGGGGHSRDPNNLTRIIPYGISVMATGVAETTTLVKVPPQCFLQMLDKFPRDVHRISQTIIARMQRVTLQTMVRCLGLQKEIVQRYNLSSTAKLDRVNQVLATRYNRPQTWQRLQDALARYVPHAAPPHVRDEVEQDAAWVAAVSLIGRSTLSENDDDDDDESSVERLVQKLQQVASVVALPPGQTLFETGESPDAIYLILHGTLDVGTHAPGASATLKQSTRRASIHKDRRHIFPHTTADCIPPTGSLPPKPVPIRRRYSSKGNNSTSNATRSSSNNVTPSTSFSRMYKATVGENMGTLSCFTGDVSIITARNSSEWENALLYKIPKEDYNDLLAEQPTALTECLGSLLDRLGSSIVCLLDWNVEWMHVQAGEDVVHHGEECDAMYAVLNGRLRAAVPYTTSGFNAARKTNPTSTGPSSPPPPALVRTTSTSFLSRAKQRLRNRRSILKFNRKSHPKVARQPPPLSRRIMDSAGEEVQGEEFGRGAIIGEVEILTGADWAADVYATRHSELARVPVSCLNAIIQMFPRAGLHLARVVASQIQRARKKHDIAGISEAVPPMHIDTGRPRNSIPSPTSTAAAAAAATATATTTVSPSGNVSGRNILPSYGLNLSTVAVVPLLEGDFDLDRFSDTLQQTLHTSIAPTTLMTKAYAREQLGEDVFRQRNAMHSLKMTRLLGDMEENSRVVVYQADAKYTWWTRLCIQQADCILLVVRAEEAPPQKKVEACLSWAFTALGVKIQLVVLQSNKECQDDKDYEDETVFETMESSDQLNDWSEARYWIAGHHLVRMPFTKHVLDFRRLCRRVTGRSVGVVLGGGGARGLAHIGVIRALMEAGITVDFVGGTSQGAYIGALLAMQPDDFPALVKAARQMAASMSNNWEKLFDLTLPLVSFFSGYRFNRGIQKSLGKRRIQDLVCNFFCVSTDIRNNVQVVHTKGVCWRYVRASMTLQSYLPPLAEEGTLLVDGGYMNVLPADIMKLQMRARTVIAVDVSQEVILDNYEWGSHLNGFWILLNSWNPFTKTVNIPSMGDISERLAWVGAEQQKKKVRQHIDLFLSPPVGHFGVLEYDKMDDIVKIGYDYAKPRVDHFVKKYPHLVS